MGAIRHVASDKLVPLAADQLVGRERIADLRLENPKVSAQHARIRYRNASWEVLDLGSRNGTYLFDRRLSAGERAPMKRGAEVAFGDATDVWTLVDDGPPTAVAVPEDGSSPVAAVNGKMELGDGAQLVVERSPEGRWMVEKGDEVDSVHDQQLITSEGKRYRFRSDAVVDETRQDKPPPPTIDQVQIRFTVSRDEEHVDLALAHAGGVIELPHSNHYYLLLVLARQREEDRSQPELNERDQGWMYAHDLAKNLGMSAEHLNVTVFRVRKAFERSGVQEGARIIERRRTTGQLRIGSQQFLIRGR